MIRIHSDDFKPYGRNYASVLYFTFPAFAAGTTASLCSSHMFGIIQAQNLVVATVTEMRR